MVSPHHFTQSRPFGLSLSGSEVRFVQLSDDINFGKSRLSQYSFDCSNMQPQSVLLGLWVVVTTFKINKIKEDTIRWE